MLNVSIHLPSDLNYLLKYLTFGPNIPSNDCLDLSDVDYMDEAGYNWNDWSVAGKADKTIYKTLNSIHLEDEPFNEEWPEEDVVLDRELEWLNQLPEVS